MKTRMNTKYSDDVKFAFHSDGSLTAAENVSEIAHEANAWISFDPITVCRPMIYGDVPSVGIIFG